MNCSLAQTLHVVGERWSLLIIRDASFGISRFDDFQKSLGVARNMLSMRLKHLTAAGILEKVVNDFDKARFPPVISEQVSPIRTQASPVNFEFTDNAVIALCK